MVDEVKEKETGKEKKLYAAIEKTSHNNVNIMLTFRLWQSRRIWHQ